MTTTQQVNPRRRKLKLMIRSVGSVRDNLRTKVDRFEDGAAVELAELEPKLEHLERELTSAANETVEAAAEALGKLSSAFRQLKKKAPTAPRSE